MTKEEALKFAAEMHGWLQTDREKEALETLIPELKESEDERIIKTLQEYVKNRNWPLNGPTQDEVLAWLEKQKEHKPIETWPNLSNCIHNCKNCLARCLYRKEENPEQKPADYCSVRDEFDLDGNLKQKPAEIAPNQFDGVTYGMSGHSSEKPAEYPMTPSECYKPAEWSENETRLLNEAIQMVESNGTWIRSDDAVKSVSNFLKKLRDSSEKPKEWSEEDDGVLEQIITAFHRIANGCEHYFSQNTAKVFEETLKSLRPQPKQEWSEEEKDKFNSIERLIVNANAHGNYLIGDKEAIDLQHFIRSIVKPTTNLAEWSAEDEKMRNSILDKMISLDNAYGGDGIAYGSEIAWLKSLRPQYHGDVTMTEAYKMGLEAGKALSWKPSEEQMNGFHTVLYQPQYISNSDDERLKQAESLYNDLKKQYYESTR